MPDEINSQKQSTDIEVYPTEVVDAPNVADFFARVFNYPVSESFIEWKYFKNPAGRFYGGYAKVNQKIAGFYGNTPVKIKIGEEVLTGAQAVDGMIEAEFRRSGVFVRIARYVFREMDEDGIALDYAFPNPHSEAGFLKRLDWSAVGRVPRYNKVLDTRLVAESENIRGAKGIAYRALLKITAQPVLQSASKPRQDLAAPSSPIVKHVETFDERVDRLWRQVSSSMPIAIERDLVYLNWRYVQNPQKQYRVLIAERGSELAGLAVISTRNLSTQKSAALAELLVKPGDRTAGIVLLAEASQLARQLGGSQLQCWMLPQHTFYTDMLESSGFKYLPGRYSPGILRYTTPFVIRTHPGKQLIPNPTDLRNWYISAGDHDYY